MHRVQLASRTHVRINASFILHEFVFISDGYCECGRWTDDNNVKTAVCGCARVELAEPGDWSDLLRLHLLGREIICKAAFAMSESSRDGSRRLHC